MYFAGLNLALNHNQGIEGLALIATLTHGVAFATQLRWQLTQVKEAGDVKTLPPSNLDRLSKCLKPVIFIASTGLQVVVPLVNLVGVVANGLEQPSWMQRFALPDDYVGVGGKAWLRTLACVASLGCTRLLQWTFRTLGAQWHYIGVREKAQVVSTGPYAYVRHPLYSLFIAQSAIWSVLFWSYVPIVLAGVAATALAFKIPAEEKIMEDDSSIGPAYKEYKSKVTSRVIPYVW